jgi:hypothetical protein
MRPDRRPHSITPPISQKTSCFQGGNHRSLNNVTPADVYFGRAETILKERDKIKKLTIQKRRLQHQKAAA